MSNYHIPGHEVIPVDELSVDRVNAINFRLPIGSQSMSVSGPQAGDSDIASFLQLEGSDKVKHEAATGYIEHLKMLAKKFHADGVDLLGLGGEALVFSLFRDGEPINAIIRMEPGYLHTGMDEGDIDHDSAGNEIRPVSAGPFIEEFSPADNYMPAVLPNYYRDITTVKEDVLQRGIMFKVAPMVYTLDPIDDVREVKDHEIKRVLTDIKRRHVIGRMDTTEIIEPNIGFYPLAAPSDSNPNAYKLHAISIDPGNMQHGHNEHEPDDVTSARRIFWPTKFKELFTHGEAADAQMLEEVKEDAKRLMNGEESEFSKRITNIRGTDLSQSWADMVQAARAHQRVNTPS